MGIFSIGGVDLLSYECPDDGAMEFGKTALWAYLQPIGYDGTLRQFHGYESNRDEWHLFCGEVTMNALVALVGPTPVIVSAPRPKFENGVECTIESVSAQWTKQVPGEWTAADIAAALGTNPTGDKFGWYDVTIKFVEGVVPG